MHFSIWTFYIKTNYCNSSYKDDMVSNQILITNILPDVYINNYILPLRFAWLLDGIVLQEWAFPLWKPSNSVMLWQQNNPHKSLTNHHTYQDAGELHWEIIIVAIYWRAWHGRSNILLITDLISLQVFRQTIVSGRTSRLPVEKTRLLLWRPRNMAEWS